MYSQRADRRFLCPPIPYFVFAKEKNKIMKPSPRTYGRVNSAVYYISPLLCYWTTFPSKFSLNKF